MKDGTTRLVDAQPGQRKSAPAALVCFSHLRWNFVWQRPQHLLSRFAQRVPVFVVEEPEFIEGDDTSGLRVAIVDGVTVVTPQLPWSLGPKWGFNPITNPLLRDLLTPYFADLVLAGRDAANVIVWYYTAMAIGAEPAGLTPVLTVYDAMDELANFHGAPQALREREATLMGSADLVFAGGPSLYESRKGRHPRVHCFPSGVDPAHFAQAADDVVRPVDLDARPRPIIGFYGVIDERIDLELVAAIADARPDWTIAMIGPVVKIDQATLPQRPNIAYFGKREYRDLPSYLACFDVAILPFARNEATRFISPTKTLEYMAGEKPIVSTPIKDVVDLYGAVVEFGETPGTFVAAVERALTETAAARARRLERSRAVLAQHAWDAIAEAMWSLIVEALATPGAVSRRGSVSPAIAGGSRTPATSVVPPIGSAASLLLTSESTIA